MEENENNFELVENRDAIELVPTWQFQWWWVAVAAAVLVLITVAILRMKRGKESIDPGLAEREAYKKAAAAFGEMDCGSDRDTAIRVSVVLRAYLAESLSEPALYETHEEFIGRHDALGQLPDHVKAETAQFFEKLAAVKYGPSESGGGISDGFKTRGKELLERMHAA